MFQQILTALNPHQGFQEAFKGALTSATLVDEKKTIMIITLTSETLNDLLGSNTLTPFQVGFVLGQVEAQGYKPQS